VLLFGSNFLRHPDLLPSAGPALTAETLFSTPNGEKLLAGPGRSGQAAAAVVPELVLNLSVSQF
jgi:hypothetical protein